MPKWRLYAYLRRAPTITDIGWDRPSRLAPEAAMERAVALAGLGPSHGPNPRVGCVITDSHGKVVGEGYHQGSGTAHAEVVALNDARERGESTQGTTAFVSLEPCAHTGRTGPCTEALIAAGVAHVRYAVEDPNPLAQGGARVLADAGLEVRFTPHDGARDLNRRWLAAVALGRPYVIAKWAATLDGRTSAIDGTSFWITGEDARAHAHGIRAEIDAIVVGTGTVAVDNPQLSARPADTPDSHQPVRVVMGLRDTGDAEVWRDANSVAAATHDPAEVLDMLHARDVRTVLVEGGATVTTAFLAAGLVDEVHAYIAPVILGSGTTAVGDMGITTMTEALRGGTVERHMLGDDTLIVATYPRGI